MPLRQFKLYDVLVDVLPGIIFLLLLTIFLPFKSINGLLSAVPSGLPITLLLLVISYVIGRIIHFTTSIFSGFLNSDKGLILSTLFLYISYLLILFHYTILNSSEKISRITLGGTVNAQAAANDINSLFKYISLIFLLLFSIFLLRSFIQVLNLYIEVLLHMQMRRFSEIDPTLEPRIRDRSEVEQLLKILPAEHPEEYIERWLNRENVSIMKPQKPPNRIESKINKELRKKMQYGYSFKTEMMNPVKDGGMKWIRHIGYSKLHDKNTLYSKYNELATFFRSLSFIFWFFFIFYALQDALIYFGYHMLNFRPLWNYLNPDTRHLVLLLLLSLSIISSLQLTKFSKYRNRQFVIDIYHENHEVQP